MLCSHESLTRHGPLTAFAVRPAGVEGAAESPGVATGAYTAGLRLPPPSIATTEYVYVVDGAIAESVKAVDEVVPSTVPSRETS